MRIFFIITYLLFLSNALVSQSTGFYGTRVHMGYGFNFSPAFFGANAQNETIIGGGGSAATGFPAFNMIHEGFLEVAPSSKFEIGLSLRYYKTAYDNAMNFQTYYGGSNYGYLNENPSGYYNIRGMSYTLYMRYFGSRYVAPWGRYLMFGPVINTVKTTYDPLIMKAQYYETYSYGEAKYADFGLREQSYYGFNLMFGAGRSRVVANRVTIDYGFNTHLFSIVTALFDVGDATFFSTRNVTHDNYIEATNKRRVRGVNRFNVFLKVGILLF